jgi:putative transposase
MAFGHDEQRVRAERARTIGLFRYALIREAADEKLSTRQRGRLVRTLAEREHEGPFGQPVRVSRATIDRWIRDWRRGGFDALVPTPRKAVPRTPADVLELAVALKREVPERTAAQIAAILRAHSGWSPDERTLQRNFVRLELTTRADGHALATTLMPGRSTLVADRRRGSRCSISCQGTAKASCSPSSTTTPVVHRLRWARREDTVRLEAALRTGIASRVSPRASTSITDRPSWTSNYWRVRVIGHPVVHRVPASPPTGKIERAFRTVRDQFLVEIGSGRELDDLAQLNTLFTAWVRRSTTGGCIRRPGRRHRPLVGHRRPGPAVARAVAEAFCGRRAHRHQDRHRRPARQHLRSRRRPGRPQGRTRLRPVDLTTIEVRWHGRSMGPAVPHKIGRHVHHKARPDDTTPPTPAPTGIDYLHLVEAQHTAELAERVQYSRLRAEQPPDRPVPGQLQLPGTEHTSDDSGGVSE